MLDLAILGLLEQNPMHGYELRGRISEMYGTIRTVSFGSLYPILRRLETAELIEPAPAHEASATSVPGSGRTASARGKNRKTYRLTENGRTELTRLLATPTVASYSDDSFGVHLALFDRTPAHARLQVLEGRRRYLESRREDQRGFARPAGTTNPANPSEPGRYSRQLTLLGLETSERELRWLDELIQSERSGKGRSP